jgi:hypothetical protein
MFEFEFLEASSRSEVSKRGLEARSRSEVSKRGLEARSRSEVSKRVLEASSRSEFSKRVLKVAIPFVVGPICELFYLGLSKTLCTVTDFFRFYID